MAKFLLVEVAVFASIALSDLRESPYRFVSRSSLTSHVVFLPLRASQHQLYEAIAAPLLPEFFDGYNCSILAYGQTGSGKTFTMGSGALSFNDVAVGIIPRVIRAIFDYTLNAGDKWRCTVRVSFVEVYNEQVRDLLTSAGTPINVRDDCNGNVVITGMEEKEVASVGEIERVVREGTLSRATGSTKMNAQSSRSHAILVVSLEQEPVEGAVAEDGQELEHRFSKFYLVDLAGSERAKKTMSEGQRFTEGVNINKGLLALGNVIKALSSSAQKEEKTEDQSGVEAAKAGKAQRGAGESLVAHVPYRDSKLTRILQDSLGGNSRTSMIACVSPADVNADESLNTLR